MIYCKPRFGEGILGRGMGFGNRLFPWARCRVFSKIHDIPMISPVWMRPAFGQLLRGGVDYHSYLRQLILYGLFKRRDGDLGVIEGFLKSFMFSKGDEPEDLNAFSTINGGNNDQQIVFAGYDGFFSPINGYHEFLYSELREITRLKYLRLVDSIDNVPIGICVRCGNDFATPPAGRKVLLPGEKTPLKWFVDTLLAVRVATGFSAKAFVVSDGAEEHLSELLALENVHFVRPGSAVGDLLLLSRANVLLASGSSSFAAWGSFLGQMPSASHPGQPLTDWGISPSRGQFLGEFNPNNPDRKFLRDASEALLCFRAQSI